MMSSARREIARKKELLERYRALRLEEVLEELAPEAERRACEERFPWRGAFRTREEILGHYRQRRKMDRRFMLDMLILVVILAGVVLNGRRIISGFVPKPNTARHATDARPG